MKFCEGEVHVKFAKWFDMAVVGVIKLFIIYVCSTTALIFALEAISINDFLDLAGERIKKRSDKFDIKTVPPLLDRCGQLPTMQGCLSFTLWVRQLHRFLIGRGQPTWQAKSVILCCVNRATP